MQVKKLISSGRGRKGEEGLGVRERMSDITMSHMLSQGVYNYGPGGRELTSTKRDKLNLRTRRVHDLAAGTVHVARMHIDDPVRLSPNL